MTDRPREKRLKYRDQIGNSLEAHTAHWANFVWQGGPYVVSHLEGPWGRVQVWASSVAEGKRVIRHAGTIAGVDPDQVGRWEWHVVQNPRYGKPGTFRVKVLRGGYLHVTKREGTDGWPFVAGTD